MDVPYNLMGALVGCTIFKFAQFSTDHEFVQRQLTCKSVKKAGVSLVYSQILSLPIVLIFLSIGLLFYVSYSTSADPAAIMRVQERRARHLPAVHLPLDPDGRAGHYGHRPAGRRAVEFQLGDQRHGQQLLSPTSTCRCASVWDMRSRRTATRCRRRRKMVVLMGDRAHRFCDRHGRHAGEERAEPGRFRYGRDELLLRRDARRLPARFSPDGAIRGASSRRSSSACWSSCCCNPMCSAR